MRRAIHTAKHKILLGMVCLTGLFLTGCIRESLVDCEPDATSVLYVSVEVDEDSDTAVEGATLYLFDANRRYVTQVPVTQSQMEDHAPVQLPADLDKNAWAVVWGNLNGGQSVTAALPQMLLDEMKLSMSENEQGLIGSPDDLFFGIKQLTGLQKEEIAITPKTARIHLTVRGLPQGIPATSYFFTTETGYTGYDFTGSPLAESGRMQMPGEFDTQHDLVTPRVHNLIHYPAPDARSDVREAVTVNLWRIMPGGMADELLVSVREDTDANPIRPQAGKTTNVLILINAEGEIEVSIEITDWDETHQWNEW